MSQVKSAFDHIRFAEVFTHLRILWVEFDRLQVVTDAFVGTPQFTRGVTAIV
ncbi:hypothetical protein D3C84_1115920 [compost metagenome]